ncbi:AmmeMemoRadiSam system radical SAM enzyme [Lentisphaerota bacterium ZTH]|nr:AmmeMemoRadiSam system radical SAM enzyme [Lentisphaerota bacterium]WET05590.1 AmmeMemoRadiSam system radical SAM enzyme [Lentisphaerota bacterium ZTH]
MLNQETSHPAQWWERTGDNDKVKCLLCPRGCVIAPEKIGFCGVRKNIDGDLYTLAYGRPVALNVDPIEKKPLAEFMPGTTTFSLGTFGCNLNCSFCQNDSLSRGSYSEAEFEHYVSPEDIIELAQRHKCDSVAFTYNEPTVFAEYAIDIARLAHENNLKTVLVTNGYITPEAACDLYPLIDAANIDMKGFTPEFYASMTGSELAPVLHAIKYFYELKKHLEITNLIIPERNDSDEMINNWLDWVETHLDKSTPLHFSAFHPAFNLLDVPPTSPETLYRIRDIAGKRGFRSVYLGNI